MRKFTFLLTTFLVIGFAAKAATYTIDFENEKKTAYASADLNLGGPDSIKWNLTDAIIAKASMANADYYEGSGSLRMRGYTTTVATMLANKLGGIGNISFKYKIYGTDSQIPFNIDWSSDGTTWTNIGQITANSTIQTFSYDLNQSDARIRIIAAGTSTSNKRMNIDNIVITDNGGTPPSLTPTITPATGNIYNPITVTITAAAGASIYYTTNGTEPTNASIPYTEPFTVNTTTTVKAIAYETDKDPSTVATATYTMASAIEIPNISSLRSLSLPSTEAYKLTGEAVLTLQSSTRNTKYIQDATGAIIIDDASKKITTAYNLGDGITGIVGTLALFQNMLQFTPIADPGAATSTGKTITPLALSLGDLASHQAELVKVTGVTISDIDAGTGVFVVSKSYNLNGSANPILRTQYADLDYIGAAIPSAPLDMVGVVLVYASTAQFVPRSLAEMVSTGVSTVKENLKIFAANGKINFEATDGELVEVYNTVGQKVLSAVTISGNNTMAVNAKGVVFVKVGNRTGKVIL